MADLYKRSPITEAVIGIMFSEPLEPAKLAKADKKFAKNYPQHTVVQNFDVKVQLGQDGRVNAEDTRAVVGHRRSSTDADELLVIWPAELVASQLAPYPGWDAFIARFERDWRTWKQVAGYREIRRIGLRFINRIDVPIVDDKVEHEKYLNIYAHVPNLIGSVNGYSTQIATEIEGINCLLKVNSGTVRAPILEHTSFLLDIDFGRMLDVPQKDDDILALLHEIRVKKNEVFEACITKRARKLFQK
jgi:uncharacterized protein (TIGR04255 family)